MKLLLALCLFSSLGGCFADRRCPSFENGKQCGCWKGRCWAYLTRGSKPGAPWCYTQVECFAEGLEKWAKCSSNRDCNWAQACGGNATYSCHQDGVKPEADNLNCANVLDGSRCGCWRGKCRSFVSNAEAWKGRKGNGKWCYTQKLGVAFGQRDYANCSSTRDCSWEMTCGDHMQFQGSNEKQNVAVPTLTIPDSGDVVIEI